ncbi:hypothetical protein GCM10009826_45980 [Humibacillus xanthopallidus]
MIRQSMSGSEVPVSVVYGTSVGGVCLDADRFGGNPFATALIGLVASQDLPYRELLGRLRRRTRRASGGVQEPELHLPESLASWQLNFTAVTSQHTRAALMLVETAMPETRCLGLIRRTLERWPTATGSAPLLGTGGLDSGYRTEPSDAPARDAARPTSSSATCPALSGGTTPATRACD